MHRTLFGLIMVFLLGAGVPTTAQTLDVGSNPVQANEAELRDLIKTLESDSARKKLISQLNALLAARKSAAPKTSDRTIGTRILDLVSLRIDSISAEFVAGSRAIMDVSNVYDWVAR